MSQTWVVIEEPELQPQGGLTPPATPTRTAVATDEPEKPPCRFCGHTKADHLGQGCRAQVGMRGATVSTSAGVVLRSTCACPRYEPKEDR